MYPFQPNRKKFRSIFYFIHLRPIFISIDKKRRRIQFSTFLCCNDFIRLFNFDPYMKLFFFWCIFTDILHKWILEYAELLKMDQTVISTTKTTVLCMSHRILLKTFPNELVLVEMIPNNLPEKKRSFVMVSNTVDDDDNSGKSFFYKIANDGKIL